MAQSITFDAARLDVLMPMHVLVSPDGIIRHAGPTLKKVHPGRKLVGQPFFGLFERRRPGDPIDLTTFCRTAGTKLSLRLRDPDRTPVTGSAICLEGDDGVLVNLSFGIAVVEAVARFGLAGSDFAATDLTLELLYLVEANAAAMEEASKTGARLAGAKDAAQAEALTDPLTGLDNRRGLDIALNRLISRGTRFALMHIDLDFFKAVNDTYGHAAGDLVLQRVAASLRAITRGGDVVARVGGDEFVAVFIRATDATRLAELAGRLIAGIEEPVQIGETVTRVSASVGVTATDLYDRPELERMVNDADAAAYASKRRGRSCFTLVHHDRSLTGTVGAGKGGGRSQDVSAALPGEAQRGAAAARVVEPIVEPIVEPVVGRGGPAG